MTKLFASLVIGAALLVGSGCSNCAPTCDQKPAAAPVVKEQEKPKKDDKKCDCTKCTCKDCPGNCNDKDCECKDCASNCCKKGK
jgi:hypothetical protein